MSAASGVYGVFGVSTSQDIKNWNAWVDAKKRAKLQAKLDAKQLHLPDAAK